MDINMTMMMLFPQTLRHSMASLGAEGDDLLRPPPFYYSTLSQGCVFSTAFGAKSPILGPSTKRAA